MYTRPILKRKIMSVMTMKPEQIIELIREIEKLTISEQTRKIAIDVFETVKNNAPEEYRDDLIICYLYRLGYLQATKDLQNKK